MNSTMIQAGPLIALLIVAAAIDAWQRRIPNWLTMGLLASGLARSAWAPAPPDLSAALAGMAAGLGIGLAMYLLGALGGGDVKLLAAVGAWVGPGPFLLIFLVQCIVGMAMVLVQSVIQGRTRPVLRNTIQIAARFAAAPELGLGPAIQTGLALRGVQRPLPYAVPVLIATLTVLGAQRWMVS